MGTSFSQPAENTLILSLPSTGDISIFQGMPLEKLTLTRCTTLTGKLIAGVLCHGYSKGLAEIFSQFCRKILSKLNPKTLCLSTKFVGDIGSLKDCPLQGLSLSGALRTSTKFTGTLACHC